MINNKARYNQIDAKYRQMAFQSVPTNPYLEFLVKRNWCKFRGLCLHIESVVILSNCFAFKMWKKKIWTLHLISNATASLYFSKTNGLSWKLEILKRHDIYIQFYFPIVLIKWYNILTFLPVSSHLTKEVFFQ